MPRAFSLGLTGVFLLLPSAAVCFQTRAPSVYENAASELQRGNPTGAAALVEPLLKQQPQDLRALTLLGMALGAQGRAKEADQQFEQALKVNARYAPALRGLALSAMASGRAEAAGTHFDKLLEIAPGDELAHLALGEIRYNERRYADAVRHFAASGGAYLHDARTVLKFADAAVQSKQTAKAVQVLESMPASAEPDQHLQAGLMMVRLGAFKQAAREFEFAAKGKDKYLAGYNLALARLQANEHEAAVQTVQELLAGGFRTAELYNVQAHAYEKGGRTKEAYEALRTATQIDPGDETNYLDLIAICLDHKNLDLALQITDIGLRLLPKSDRLQLQRGVVLAMKGDYDQAKVAFSAASDLAPAKGLPQVALGLVLLQVDEPEKAAQVLRAGSASKEDRYLFRWFLAEALGRAGAEPGSEAEKEAVAGLRECVAQRPDLAQPRILLGKFLARRGEFDGAVQHLESALRIDPENTTATYQLAQAYRRKGDKRAAALFAKVSKAKAEEREELTRKGLELITEGSR